MGEVGRGVNMRGGLSIFGLGVDGEPLMVVQRLAL
jgi:hypothetical protein